MPDWYRPAAAYEWLIGAAVALGVHAGENPGGLIDRAYGALARGPIGRCWECLKAPFSWALGQVARRG